MYFLVIELNQINNSYVQKQTTQTSYNSASPLFYPNIFKFTGLNPFQRVLIKINLLERFESSLDKKEKNSRKIIENFEFGRNKIDIDLNELHLDIQLNERINPKRKLTDNEATEFFFEKS